MKVIAPVRAPNGIERVVSAYSNTYRLPLHNIALFKPVWQNERHRLGYKYRLSCQDYLHMNETLLNERALIRVVI